MKIGNTKIDLKNMSKNQRKLFKALKEKYEQALAEGVDVGDEFYGSLDLGNGKVKMKDIEYVERSTPSEFYGYNPVSKMEDFSDEDAEYYRIRVEEFIRRVTPTQRTSRKGRKRQFTKGQQVMEDIVDKLRLAVDLYRYKKVAIAIDMIPDDIKQKIYSSDPHLRYSGYSELYDFLQTIDFSSINVNLDNNYDEVDDAEGDEW